MALDPERVTITMNNGIADVKMTPDVKKDKAESIKQVHTIFEKDPKKKSRE